MAGHYKRGTGLAVLIAFGNFSGCAYPASKLELSETAETSIDSDSATDLPSGGRPALCPRLYVSLPLALHKVVLNLLVDTIEIMFSCLGILALCIAVVIYPRVNALRAKRQLEMRTQEIVLTADEIRAMGDRAPDFRYTL